MKFMEGNQKLLNKFKLVEITKFENYKSAPRSQGVYILLDQLCEVIYVGKSNNLRKRLTAHFRDYISARTLKSSIIKERTKYITYCEILEAFETDMYETWLISHFKPVLNTDKLFNTSRDTEIRLVNFENEMKEKNYDDELKSFLISFFKTNKNIEIGIHTVKMVCENNGFLENVVPTTIKLSEVEESKIIYRNGKFTYKG
ncbi:GIY-YIG nuclease family protein [Rummeliibacillus sp. POC4]|uniref:GIY-YIG nuclease family protein n=1 Tax=Rummeliibacillus sp. POC4 TaxID=2305899 RepID=UPI000E6697CC|nr:GIY-YIG nuclease family protein [Rummeliibacillus sp. POC4]RIJ64154.1 hypothetical protein D1606_11615 [Rummeliibacillus sp. POC4]